MRRRGSPRRVRKLLSLIVEGRGEHGKREAWKIPPRPRVQGGMFATPHAHQDLARMRQAELIARARHDEQIRAARAGRLQPELRAGRDHARRTRLAALLRGRPAMV
jgi:hypothetical protein